jgi:hypothetical protein
LALQLGVEASELSGGTAPENRPRADPQKSEQDGRVDGRKSVSLQVVSQQGSHVHSLKQI